MMASPTEQREGLQHHNLRAVPSLSQVGIVLTAQHLWLPPGLASLRLRDKNPQVLLKLQMISPFQEEVPNTRAPRRCRGGREGAHTDCIPLSTWLPGPGSGTSARMSLQAPLLLEPPQLLRCWEDPGGPGSHESENGLLPCFP